MLKSLTPRSLTSRDAHGRDRHDDTRDIPRDYRPATHARLCRGKPHADPGRGKWLELAPVYRIMKQNGSSIEVDSALGNGTTVRIYLLRIAPDAEAGMAQTIHKVLDMPASDNVQTGG